MTHWMAHLVEERGELIQEIDKFGLDIHSLKYELSANVDVFNAQQDGDELCEAEKEFISQIEERKLEGLLLDHTFLDVFTVDKSIQESCENVNSNIIMS